MVQPGQVDEIATAIDSMRATVERIERLLRIRNATDDELLDPPQAPLEVSDLSGQI